MKNLLKSKLGTILFMVFISVMYVISVSTFNKMESKVTVNNNNEEQTTNNSCIDKVQIGILRPIIHNYSSSILEEINTTIESETIEEEITEIEEETTTVIETTTEKVEQETTTVIIEEETTTSADKNTYTEEDFYILSHIINAEAGGCSREIQMMVGSVVLNRVKSKYYPNDIKSVVFQKGQYSPTWNGSYYKEPTALVLEVTKELLENGSILPENVVFQANFKQGKGVYKQFETRWGIMYFCYK